MPDLHPAAATLAGIVRRIRDDQLSLPTPCRGMTVAALLDHVHGLAKAFTAAAEKTTSDGVDESPSADGSRLPGDWRDQIPARLDRLAEAWQIDGAWSGMTRAGGIDLPGDVAGLVAIDELVVHGWDLAVSTGQRFEADPESLTLALAFVRQAVAEGPGGTPGLFDPPVLVPDDAPMVDRLIGLTGRDPSWRPSRVEAGLTRR